MPIDLYYDIISFPCRMVMITAKLLNVELSLKTVDLSKGDHTSPEFLKLNPQHTIPTLVDDGLILTESRAILTYLVNKYGKGSPLYPEEPRARALADQRLYFDVSTLYQRYAEYAYPQIFGGQPADEEKLRKLHEALEYLESFLAGSEFVAGPHLTLADLSIAVSLSNFTDIAIDFSKYPKITAWLKNVKKTPYFQEINEPGRLKFAGLMKSLMKN